VPGCDSTSRHAALPGWAFDTIFSFRTGSNIRLRIIVRCEEQIFVSRHINVFIGTVVRSISRNVNRLKGLSVAFAALALLSLTTTRVNAVPPPGFVDASTFGFATDPYIALQAAINTGRDVYVPNVGTWSLRRPVFMLNDNQEVLFGTGVTVEAMAGTFTDRFDSLFEINDRTGVTLRAETAGTVTLSMALATAVVGEGQKVGIRTHNAQNLKILGLNIEDAAGDGIYIGASVAGDVSGNVLIQDVTISNAFRNGISVIGVDGLVIDNTVIVNTGGTPPQAGIDFEPDSSGQRIVNVTVRNTVIAGNGKHGIMWHLNNLSDDGASSTGLIENVTVSGNIGDGLSMGPMPLLNWDIRDSLLINQGDDGFDVDSGPGTQTIEYSAFFGNADTNLRGDVLFGTGTFDVNGTPPDIFVNTTDPTDPLYFYLKPGTSTIFTEGASDGGFIGARGVAGEVGASLSASVSDVPEPTSAVLLGLAAMSLPVVARNRP